MPATILIVDDEDRIRSNFRKLFEKERFNVLETASAANAKDLIVHEKVDLILLDINLGEVNGDILFEVTSIFHKEIKVIVASVYPLEDQKELIHGADDYYDKSESLSVLVEKVKKVIGEGSAAK